MTNANKRCAKCGAYLNHCHCDTPMNDLVGEVRATLVGEPPFKPGDMVQLINAGPCPGVRVMALLSHPSGRWVFYYQGGDACGYFADAWEVVPPAPADEFEAAVQAAAAEDCKKCLPKVGDFDYPEPAPNAGICRAIAAAAFHRGATFARTRLTADLDPQKAECERLRSELEISEGALGCASMSWDSCDSERMNLRTQLAAAQAQNRRLREALSEVDVSFVSTGGPVMWQFAGKWPTNIETWKAKRDAALADGAPETGSEAEGKA